MRVALSGKVGVKRGKSAVLFTGLANHVHADSMEKYQMVHCYKNCILLNDVLNEGAS